MSVAIGELAPGLSIDLDKVPKKYEGLDGTELAISESQERMAVVLAPEDVAAFSALAHEENLQATPVATVTAAPRLQMHWRDQQVVDIARAFLDTNGVTGVAEAEIPAPDAGDDYREQTPDVLKGKPLNEAFFRELVKARGLLPEGAFRAVLTRRSARGAF